MTEAIYYPPADRTAQWFAGSYPGTEMSDVDKVLWHTTEGSGWPSYDGGAKAPTLTYHARYHLWHQHFPLNRSARALMDPDGTPVRENRDNVVQVEIIATADPGNTTGLLFIGDLDDRAVNDLGAFSAFMNREWGTPLTPAPVWLPYPQSYGDSPARMTSAEYDAFKGHLGHMHASGNHHGDPGDFPITRVLSVARSILTPEMFTVGQFEDIMAKLQKIDNDATARYGDVAGRVQAVLNEERARYNDYVGRFNAILADLAADPNNPVTPEDAERFREMAAAVDRIELAVQHP
jgi:hypothetical protein